MTIVNNQLSNAKYGQSMNAMEDTKIPLLKFLKLLTDNDVPVPAAMSVAGKMYVKVSC